MVIALPADWRFDRSIPLLLLDDMLSTAHMTPYRRIDAVARRARGTSVPSEGSTRSASELADALNKVHSTGVATGGELRRLARVASGVAIVYFGSALYERFASHDRKRKFQRSVGNPFGETFMRWLPGWAVIETIGWRTGQPRRVPVGGRRIGNSFWLVAADPRDAGYVRNITADPHVRVQLGRTWMSGVAHLLPEDEPRKRMIRLNPVNGCFIWLGARDHLSIRVDLDAV